MVRATGVWSCSAMLTYGSLLRRPALHDLGAEILWRHCLLDAAQCREVVEQPAPEPVDRAGEEQQPSDHQQHAHRLLHLVEMATEFLHETKERSDGYGGEDEGNAEPERVDEQQLHAGGETPLVRGQRQNGRQYRPDARCPPESEG